MLRKRAVAMAVALTALLIPVAFGLGVGTLKTKSALNEPFEARIDIVNANIQDFDSLTVKLADEAQFSRAGVLREAVLLNLQFEIVSSEAASDYIRITTKDPVREPFLNFLLELNWAKGRLVREYTVLLDPPLYDRNRQPAVSRATPTQPGPIASPTVSSSAAAPSSAVTSANAVQGPGGSTIGPTQATDTAWGLALQYRPDATVSVHRMMLALLRANPQAFVNANVNLLRRGAVMRVPTSSEIGGLSQAEAVAEIRRQHQLWEEYRGGVTAEATEAPLGSPDEPVDTGTPEPEAADATDDARLELAAPDADDSSAQTPGGEVGGEAEAPTADATLIKEDLDAKAQENSELQAKISEADQIIDLLQRQIQVKDEELAALQARLGESGAAVPGDDTAPKSEAEQPAPETPTAEVKPTPPPVVETPTVKPEPVLPRPVDVPEVSTPSGVTGTLNNLIPEHVRNVVPGGALTVIGIVASLVLMLLYGVGKAIFGNRDKAIVSPTRTVATVVAAATASAPDALLATREDLTAFDSTPVDQERFQRTMEATTEQLTSRLEEDPLEEVNVYLAYERFDQAEELVKKVIDKYPNENLYKLRLLEIYYSANNQRAYEAAARDLHAAVGDSSPLWENANAMWAEMSPERALFAPGAEYAAAIETTANSNTFVDITLDNPAPSSGGQTVSMVPGGDDMLASTQVGLTNDLDGTTSSLDFDLGDSFGEAVSDSDVLDITAGDSQQNDAVFDLTATSDDVLDLTATTEPSADDSDAVFDISGEDYSLTTKLETNLVPTVDLLDVTDSSEIEFDSGDALLDTTRAPPAGDADTATINAITGSFDQEFDISDTVVPPARDIGLAYQADANDVSEMTANEADDNGGDFDLDLDVSLEPNFADLEVAQVDTELSLQNPTTLDFDIGEPDAEGDSEADVEFDLALQDTTDFENLAIDDTLELPKSATNRSGMLPVDGAGESLEDLTRSMEQSIAGLDLDDDKNDDSILDLALEPPGSDDIDLDFGLDEEGSGLDTLALDPDELMAAADSLGDRTAVPTEEFDGDYTGLLDETDTKLNLAKAYIELGDNDGARAILTDVAAEGSEAQQEEARKLLAELA